MTGNTDQEGTRRYVRLAETTLLPAPGCYSQAEVRESDLGSETCWLCMVRRQCEERQEVELR